MKSKIFSLFILTALVLSVGLTSALDINSDKVTVTLTNSHTSDTFTISSAESFNITSPDFPKTAQITIEGKQVYLTITPTSTINNTKNVIFNVVATTPLPSDLEFGIGSVQLPITAETIDGSATDNIEVTLKFESNTYCELGEQGSFINIKGVDDEERDNSDSWEWRPLDNIELTVEIENTDDDYELDGVIEYGLYDLKQGDFIFEDEMDFSVDEDEKEEFTIEFQIDPTDLDEATGDNDYIFVIKVYDDDDYSEEEQCAQFSHSVKITRYGDEVIPDVDDVTIPEEVSCGSEVEMIVDLYNIGTDDQKDVSAYLYNKDLGIAVKQLVGDIDSTSSESAKLSFDIPSDVKPGTYRLELRILDEDDDLYEIKDHDGDKEDAIFFISLEVKEGNCKFAPHATVSAVLDSDAKAGKEVIIKATVKNTGTNQETYTFRAGDYDSWASLGDISPAATVLNAGESTEVIYKLNINKDVSGSHTFNIEVKTGDSDKETLKQPVSLTITESSGFSLPGISGFAVSNDNWYLWGIGALNVVLILIIIIVAIRVAKS